MAEQTDLPAESPMAVVGLGASAGGMAALKQFFSAIPAKTGIAYFVVMHLDPGTPSMLPSLLANMTGFVAVEAVENGIIEPDHVYIIPPGMNLLIHEGRVRLVPRMSSLPTAIDTFFRSLAEDRQEKAVAVVLSGGGSDGALGIREIKARGGLVLVQDPNTAEHPEMPQSAIATDMVDFVLPPAEMPEFVLRFVKHPDMAAAAVISSPTAWATDFLQDVLTLVEQRIGHDFRCYKETTLRRRVWRRMSLMQMQQPMEYLQVLRDNPAELDALARDLVISVTYFFRDTEAWKVVQEQALPELLASRRPDMPLRIWVPGCSTGEEAYTLAILFLEAIESQSIHRRVQIFATDINEQALEKARAGVYPETIAADVSPERLRRFFVKEGAAYRISKKVRECVVFAAHNVVSDPAFSRLDLISCRNLLIYLDHEAQRRVMPVFHYALQEGGYLILGGAESVANLERQFQAISPKWRIFRRIGVSRMERTPLPFPLEPPTRTRVKAPVGLHPPARSLTEIAQQLTLDRFGPASALVDRQYHTLVLCGPTDLFLRVPTGELDNELLSLVREGLRAKLRSALHQATKDGGEVVQTGRVKRNGEFFQVRIVVTPVSVPDFQENLVLVTFHGGTEVQEPPDFVGPTSTEEHYVRQLERELHETRLELHSTIEQLEGSNEELKASHEEAVSMNEELQSSNEELETSKEELQSLNEELTTLNNQLEEKVAQLEATTNDLDNLLTSTDIATLFLDPSFHIRQFTPAAVELFHLIPTDVGRPIHHFAARFNVADLLADGKEVLGNLSPREQQMQNEDGRWFLRRTLPYRTRDNRIEGIAVTFHDITQLKLAEQALQRTVERLQLLAEVSSQLLASDRPQEIVDSLCRRVMEHLDCQAFFNYLVDPQQNKLRLNSYEGISPEAAAGIEWLEYGSDVCGCTACDPSSMAAKHIQATVQPRTELVRKLGFQAYACYPLVNQGRVIGTLSFGSRKRASFTDEELGLIRAVADQVAIAMQRIGLMQSLEKRAAEAQSANVAKSQFLTSMSHELRTPMNAILGMTDLALTEELSPTVRDYVDTARESASVLLELLNDILDLSRIEAGRLRIEAAPFRLRSLLDKTVKSLGIRASEKGLELLYDVPDDVPDHVVGDSLRLRQVLTNLVGNAIKYTHKGEIAVRVAANSRSEQEVCLKFVVQDTGVGISSEDQQKLFLSFDEAETAGTQRNSGSGLGLSISARLVELMGGRIWVESLVGQGSEFHFTACMTLATEPDLEDQDNRQLIDALHGVAALIVTDNATSRVILEQTLLRWFMHVETATTVPEALTKIHQAVGRGQKFQVIIADAMLPEIDGFTLANWVQSGTLAGPVILMLSAVERHTAAARCKEAGVLCLEKPVVPNDLLMAIGKVLGLHGAAMPGESAALPLTELPLPSHALRILLAEDTLGNQKFIYYLLGQRGHTVEIANNGAETVELAKNHDFDVVLMDLQMPVMDGIEATAAIRKLDDPKKAKLPIIAMTAHAYKKDEERCLAAGMDAYISKPVDRRELIEMVERFPAK